MQIISQVLSKEQDKYHLSKSEGAKLRPEKTFKKEDNTMRQISVNWRKRQHFLRP